jgi:hypothetical protein
VRKELFKKTQEAKMVRFMWHQVFFGVAGAFQMCESERYLWLCTLPPNRLSHPKTSQKSLAKRISSPPHKISWSHVGVFPLSGHWTNAPMSFTASTRITSTLYPQESFNPYSVEEEPEKALPVETPRREVYSERPYSSSLNFNRSISWILGFKDRYSLFNCFVWGGAMVGFCLARSVTMNPGTIAAQLIPGT